MEAGTCCRAVEGMEKPASYGGEECSKIREYTILVHFSHVNCADKSGVTECCLQLSRQVIEVSFGGRAIKENFYVSCCKERWDASREVVDTIPNSSGLKIEMVKQQYMEPESKKKVP